MNDAGMSPPTSRSWHLIRRFFGSVFARPLRTQEQEWVASILAPSVMVLWSEQPRWDQRHSYCVAREVERTMDDTEVLGAALTHDIGKVVAGLGPIARSFATIIGVRAGKAGRAHWHLGWKRKIRDYFDHPTLGATLLEECGASPVLVEWARVHQKKRPLTALLTPEQIQVLVAADAD